MGRALVPGHAGVRSALGMVGALDLEGDAGYLARAGWREVPESDWRWILRALNPEPDQASIPLLGRAFEGRSESLLLRKNVEPDGRLLTIRLWDSGVRLAPGGQVLYLGQLSEEELVQRFGLFSYWRSRPLSAALRVPLRQALTGLEQQLVEEDLPLT